MECICFRYVCTAPSPLWEGKGSHTHPKGVVCESFLSHIGILASEIPDGTLQIKIHISSLSVIVAGEDSSSGSILELSA